jgi:8-oxo-dGTP pyrophosphatase MutT (NUDIX family)
MMWQEENLPRKRPVHPRDAASLVIIDSRDAEPRVLMGRRHKKMKFVPDAFVFPGGKLDPDDLKAQPATALRGITLFGSRTSAHTCALAMAAVRETYEETGLILAQPGDVGLQSGPGWDHFRQKGIAPHLATLTALARAITPSSSPIRFHARFYSTDAKHLTGSLKGSGELEDLDWYPISAALKLPIIDVTEFVLNEVHNIHTQDTKRTNAPLFAYRNNKPIIRA